MTEDQHQACLALQESAQVLRMKKITLIHSKGDAVARDSAEYVRARVQHDRLLEQFTNTIQEDTDG